MASAQLLHFYETAEKNKQKITKKYFSNKKKSITKHHYNLCQQKIKKSKKINRKIQNYIKISIIIGKSKTISFFTKNIENKKRKFRRKFQIKIATNTAIKHRRVWNYKRKYLLRKEKAINNDQKKFSNQLQSNRNDKNNKNNRRKEKFSSYNADDPIKINKKNNNKFKLLLSLWNCSNSNDEIFYANDNDYTISCFVICNKKFSIKNISSYKRTERKNDRKMEFSKEITNVSERILFNNHMSSVSDKYYSSFFNKKKSVNIEFKLFTKNKCYTMFKNEFDIKTKNYTNYMEYNSVTGSSYNRFIENKNIFINKNYNYNNNNNNNNKTQQIINSYEQGDFKNNNENQNDKIDCNDDNKYDILCYYPYIRYKFDKILSYDEQFKPFTCHTTKYKLLSSVKTANIKLLLLLSSSKSMLLSLSEKKSNQLYTIGSATKTSTTTTATTKKAITIINTTKADKTISTLTATNNFTEHNNKKSILCHHQSINNNINLHNTKNEISKSNSLSISTLLQQKYEQQKLQQQQQLQLQQNHEKLLQLSQIQEDQQHQRNFNKLLLNSKQYKCQKVSCCSTCYCCCYNICSSCCHHIQTNNNKNNKKITINNNIINYNKNIQKSYYKKNEKQNLQQQQRQQKQPDLQLQNKQQKQQQQYKNQTKQNDDFNQKNLRRQYSHAKRIPKLSNYNKTIENNEFNEKGCNIPKDWKNSIRKNAIFVVENFQKFAKTVLPFFILFNLLPLLCAGKSKFFI
ncbi:myb-like protein D isoform X2 [Condylostylus longicornis]|uniref:myb-like protein D isoform X2 n=1 Tax=Condylostylus longicornis TaxID=2530218 RepID=UPI00244DEA6A|nr:myb-like protein D isoform X2 [Condylostylus longicornis]